ncbi:50S ribosomal protein L20 [Babesia microti strain RI]|uniref:50S ribosomal protein L20 n=1 Tax=Babesia microti (strain RI) TaxID=1133968 RepID=I7JDF8_BABMR|nr:50S ribosomal protein L20 [Babesia microti strain RI]CCF75775.1 50S ribosomal protein L20 [Babesia microti strain RI]|eukprot:XP_012650183.1 50S ribosomal protein L20 [Babesia microti strain RI]
MKVPKQVVFEITKGFRGRSKKCLKIAAIRAQRALLHSYRIRKTRHIRYRVHWIAGINRASREWKFCYSKFIGTLLRTNIWLDRKSLYNLAITEPMSFKALVDESKHLYYFNRHKIRDISQY